MPKFLVAPNGRAIALIPRSGSHSIATAMLAEFYPGIAVDLNQHPAVSYPAAEVTGQICVLVRDPVERFRSIVAHANSTVDEQLNKPKYGCEFCRGQQFDVFFRFEDQLQDCATWLGLTTPLPHLDASEESNKPTLTPEQEASVREIYAADIALWESLR